MRIPYSSTALLERVAAELHGVEPAPIVFDHAALEAERSQPSSRRQGSLGPIARFRQAPIGRQLLSLVLLVVLLFAVLIGGGWFITAAATSPGKFGECARIGLCTNTPLTTVTARTGVTFPDGSERLRSTASRDGSWISALVRLPDGAPSLTLDSASATVVTDFAAAALESAGATELTGLLLGPSACSAEEDL